MCGADWSHGRGSGIGAGMRAPTLAIFSAPMKVVRALAALHPWFSASDRCHYGKALSADEECEHPGVCTRHFSTPAP
jgi:hypothetical protein